ncbi:MAG: alpha/beta fold hydrolase [Leptolyngbyaceae cyanobacterium CRU_2_3]|nr:alpha/beta fold hydrolase [Leptolyngbyaceae cyanobacterium CRU_2_3]
MPHKARQNPVLLIHGIDDTCAIFSRMAPALEKLGWSVHQIDLIPNNGDVGLDQLASQVADYVEKTFAPNQPIDLVGFSMGGIISRYYVQRLGGIQRVQRFVTISSPHNGTWTALLRPNLGASQMRIDSEFLSALNRDAKQLEQINFTSIWTPFDSMIVPANSSEMPVGKNHQIWVGGHAWMVTDAKSILTIAQALSEPVRVPQPC